MCKAKRSTPPVSDASTNATELALLRPRHGWLDALTVSIGYESLPAVLRYLPNQAARKGNLCFALKPYLGLSVSNDHPDTVVCIRLWYKEVPSRVDVSSCRLK